MRYLLDTCMLVALLQRELGSERIREKILLAPSGSLAISAISAAEIWRGIGQSRHSKDAHSLGLVCVTDNTRHFIRISGLTLENWLRP